jgi:hypothetical protein
MGRPGENFCGGSMTDWFASEANLFFVIHIFVCVCCLFGYHASFVRCQQGGEEALVRAIARRIAEESE